MCDADLFQLPLQPGHVDHEYIFVQIEAVIPQFFQKLILADNFFTVHKEIIQDTEFIPGQLRLFAFVPDGRQVEVQSASLSGEFAEIARVIQAEGPPDLFEEDQRIVGLGDEVNAPLRGCS